MKNYKCISPISLVLLQAICVETSVDEIVQNYTSSNAKMRKHVIVCFFLEILKAI